MSDIKGGIIIGGAGGAIAGFTVLSLQFLSNWINEQTHKHRVYEWLKKNTSDEGGKEYRSTRAIASWNNLTEDRVRYICSIHKKIFLSTGKQEDMWSIYDHGNRSAYEKRGMRSLS